MVNRLLMVGLVTCFVVAAFALASAPAPAPAQEDGSVTAGGNGIGECVSRCEARRQILFQRCLDAGNDPNQCAAHANAFAKRCKARCRGRR